MNRTRTLLVSLLLSPVSALHAAEPKLAAVFSDHMVLQRDAAVPVWGWAEPEEKITVEFAGQRKAAKAGADGKWLVKLDAMSACGQAGTLVVESQAAKRKFQLRDVLVGDVWLASGQSNMDMALFWTARGKAEVAAANFPLIRYLKVGTAASEVPTNAARGAWSCCVSNRAAGCTELGYHFARQLFAKFQIPIGIINSSYGGTSIDAWMDAKALAADPAGAAVLDRWQASVKEYPAKRAAYEREKVAWELEKASANAAGSAFKKPPPFPPHGPGSQYMPSGLYNAMIHPLVPCALRGVVWYQGENNVRRPAEYRTLFPSLITSWRERFGQGALPFYWVQLPNYNIGAEADWPGLRAAQSAALALTNTGQAVTIDIGEAGNIHPGNKDEVARRLSLIAFARAYGDTTLGDSGPSYRSVRVEGSSLRVSFEYCEGGLVAKGGDLKRFVIAGADKKFVDAEARIEKDTVVVSSQRVHAPVAARYAWANNPAGCNLYNTAGLPAAPFRTDDWELKP